MKWRDLISRVTLHRVDFAAEYVPGEPENGREEVVALNEANVASSRLTTVPLGNRHAVLLDLDVPVWLFPSSTEGHSHLYAAVDCEWTDYLDFLKAAARIGLIEPGYLAAVEGRGYSSVRLPWVSKTTPNDAGLSSDETEAAF